MPIKEKQSAFLLLAVRLIGTGLAFGTNIYISRQFGAAGMGTYSLFLSFIAGLVMLAKFGTDNLAIKYSAILHQQNDHPQLFGTWIVFSLTLLLASALLMLLISAFGKSVLATFFSSGSISFISFSLIFCLIPSGFIPLCLGALRGLNKVMLASCIEMLLMQGSLLLAMLLIPLLLQTVTLERVPIYAYLVAASVTASIALASIISSLPPKPPFHYPVAGSIFREGWYILGIGLIDFFTNWLATYVVAAHLDQAAVGIFSACWRLMVVATMPKLIFDQINAPVFARLFARGNMRELEARVRRTASIGLIIGCISALTICLFSPLILGLFGQEFVDGANALRIMAIGQAISMSCGSVGYLLIMTKEERLFRNINLAILLAQAALLPLLVSHYQIVGAAIIASTAVAANNVAAAIYANRQLKIRVSPSTEEIRNILREHVFFSK